MFYIEKTTAKSREVLFFQIIPTLVVFTAFAIATLFNWVSTKSNLSTEHTFALEQKNKEITSSIQQKIDIYDNILRNSASLFGFSDNVSTNNWTEFVSSIDLETRYPGLRSLGFSQIITPAEYSSHTDKLRASGYPDYTIYPEGTRDLYTAITLVEPLTETSRKIIGYDMYTDATRREAMEAASTSGSVTISDAVKLKLDQFTSSEHVGFLMYAPLFQNVLKSPSVSNPSSLRGFVYAPFQADIFIDKTVAPLEDSYSFMIENIKQDGSSEFLYEAPSYSTLLTSGNNKTQQSEITLLGKKWRINGVANASIIGDSARVRPETTLIGGLIFSFIVAGFVYLLLTNRARILAEKEQQSIQDAKDELLALASHQLRTPATGVKQYVGLLRQGFAGELDETQKKLLDKAYESNERQLNTINEMLFVARADAGQLKMDSARLSITELLQELIEELQPTFTDKTQTLHTEIPKKDLYVKGDKPYLRMAIENIITNASKYTHENGSVSIKLKRHESVLAIQVTDNGVGVDKKDLDLLFKKFSRIPNEMTGRVSGSGIGLYLTRKIILAHSGKILFNSEQGKGSEVTILLPRDDTNPR